MRSKHSHSHSVSFSCFKVNERSTKEEMFSALLQRTTQVKKLEIKLAGV